MTSDIIIRQAYVRIGAWQGNSPEINAAYNADTNFEQVVSESFPPQSMWDALTGVENEMATAVAMNQDSVLRDNIFDTATVASGGRIPSIGDSSSSAKIIGVWGQVRDVATGLELTPGLHEDEIRAIGQNAGGMYKTSYYSYALRPPRIYATQPNLIIDCCTFDYAARATVIAAGGNLLFPMCSSAYFDGLMAALKNQDPFYTSLSNAYEPAYKEWLTTQAGGRAVVAEAAA